MRSVPSYRPSFKERLPDGWSLKTIESLCQRVTSGGTPLRSNPSFFTAGTIPWFKTQELTDWYLDDSEEHITEEALARSSAKLFPPGTILMAMYGDGKTITSLGILGRPAASNQACCALIVDPEVADNLYVFYALKFHRYDFLHLATGGAQRNLSGSLIRNFRIGVPALGEQRAIGKVLGTLDRKIELNHRLSQTLEAVTRAIFKSWFVDFDPVQEGRLWTGLTDSELASIPEGWAVASLDSIAEFLNGIAMQRFAAEEGEDYLPVIKIAELRRGDTKDSDRAGTNVPTEYVVEDGDVLFSWSGSLEVVVWAGGRGALNQHLFKVTSREYPKWFYLNWIKEHLHDFRAIAADKATTMGHIQRRHLTEALVVIPPRRVLVEMDRIISPILEKQIQSSLESRTLAVLRDTLLPKLLSGEIRVKQAEKIVKEVV